MALRRYALQSGYTIGELVIALFLTSAIAATAAPVASSILRQHQLAGTARQLGFEIARARMQAVGQNRFMRIILLGTNQYRRESSADGVNFVADGEPISLPTGFTVAAGGTGGPRFDRQGVAAASTVITVSGPRGNQTVSTTILGRVTTS